VVGVSQTLRSSTEGATYVRQGDHLVGHWPHSSSFSFLAYSQSLEIGCLPYFHTWCGFSVALECMSDTCCKRLAEYAGRKNLIGFCVLVALLHGTQVSGHRPNFAALNRGRHLYSAGRPSCWALAHILVFFFFPRLGLFSAVGNWTSTMLPHVMWP